VMPFLDKQAEDWRRHRSRACLQADLERTLDAEQLDRAVWCLDERRMDLAALIAEMSRADATVVQRAVTAAAGLQPVSPCTDPQVLAALPSPPPPEVRAKADAVRTQLSRASTLLTAGKYPDGLERVRTALADAEALGWPPMIAAARALEGDLLAKSGSYADAEAASVRAYMDAAKVHAWDVAATAATGLVWNVGYRQARHAEGKVWAGHAEVAVLFAADTLGLREARRLHTLAILHMSTGAFADARALSERALAIYEKVLGPDHPDVAAALHLLATAHMNAGAFADAKALLDRALVIREHALGPEHPEVAACLETLAALQHHAGARAEAKALFERALAIREKVFGPDHPDVAASLNNLAVMQQKSGAYAEASALLERALAIREQALGPDHPEVATSLNNLATVHRHTGAYADAKALLGRVLAIREKALGREHPAVALALVNLAEVHQATGAHADAGALYERALAIHEKAHGPDHPNVAIALAGLGNLALAQNRPADALRRLERAVAIFDGHAGVQEGELAARFSLARALVRSGGDRARALAEARKAADGLRQAGEGAAMQLAEVEAFLAEHESPP
ncbi:MAG TPA: tetratricopeptide repeat-containing protein, partial [Nannocystis sp.]